jgi:hypothetical protein
MIAKTALYKLTGITLSAGLLLFNTSCKKVDAAGENQITNRVEMEDFDKIVLHTAGTLNYTQGNYTQVTVNTSEEAYKALRIYVEDKTLHIKRKKGFNIINQDNLVFDVIDDDTYSIEVCGSGDVFADFDENYEFDEHILNISGSGDIYADAVKGKEQWSKISGSGDIIINDLDVDRSVSRISGSGDISYSNLNTLSTEVDISGSGNVSATNGSTSYNEIEIRGSGEFRGIDFETDDTNVFISGSGEAYVQVNSNLYVHISGSGSVYYKGSPIINSTISGSGDLIDMN